MSDKVWKAMYELAIEQRSQARSESARLRAECDALRDALVWIAKRCPEPNWAEQPHNTHLEMVHDAGACARAALKEAK